MEHVKIFSKNNKGRDFFCTDLHGCYDLLHEKLKEVAFDSAKDRLFSAGDWCDRGADSKHVLDYLCEPWIHSVQANHESMLISAYENPNSRQCYQMLFCNGGEWFYDITESEQKSIYEVFKTLPLAIELETVSYKIGIVHAEVPYNNWNQFKLATKAELEWNVAATAQWARTKYDKQDKAIVKGIDIVVCGHTPTESGEVEILGNQVYADLGSFFRDKISFIELNDEFIESVINKVYP